MKFFENRKRRGAISIFLVMILIPTMLFTAVLIDGSRLSSAKAITQEAADLAAMSVLASYNQELKDEFGLFAIKDSSRVEAVYKESLNATLLAYGMSGTEEYSDRIWEILKSTVGMGNPYKGETFLNLYDFSEDGCTVSPEYSLAQWQVLENQMVEYSKFRGLYVMADRFDLLSSWSKVQIQEEENQEAAGVMEEKMSIDEENQAVDKALHALRQSISKLNQEVKNVSEDRDSYIKSLEAKMKTLCVTYTDSDEPEDSKISSLAAEYGKRKSRLQSDMEKVRTCASKVREQAEKSRTEIETAIQRLENFQSSHNGTDNEAVGGMVKDAKDNVEQYQTVYLPMIDGLLADHVLNQLNQDKDLKKNMTRVLTEIDDAITQYGEEQDEEEEQESYFYYYLTGGDSTEEINDVLYGSSDNQCYQPAVNSLIQYFNEKSWTEINPTIKVNEGKSSNRINKDFASSQSEQKGDKGKEESSAKRSEIHPDVYKTRPSENFEPDGDGDWNSGFYNEKGDLTAAKTIVSQGKNGGFIKQAGEAARDDVLCMSYLFGTFKTRLTGVEKFSSKGMSEEDKKCAYMPKWRYAHEDGELDMRFTPKKDRDTVLRGEIEYLIYGNRTDQSNEDAVYATIYAERLANNLIAMYQERKVVNPSCHAAAASASVLTAGIVPEPVFFWIFLTAWASAETVMDMNYLVHGGYRIPLLKTKDNLLLGDYPTGNGLISNYGAVNKGIFVSYEDYLMILLLIKGQQKYLMRSADLIEMNMKKKESAFSMAKAYTGIWAKTSLSTRYLFGSTAPFQDAYENGGVTGRMKFTNQIYMGY